MDIGTYLYTQLNGKLVGTDEFGNKYYTAKKHNSEGRKKRWVIYKKVKEPSLIPPAWHGWIHYRTDTLPTETGRTPYEWEKGARPNLTGSSLAYYPPGDARGGGQREKATGDYQPWQP